MSSQPRKTVYVSYFDGIDRGRVKALMGLVNQIISKEKPDSIYFLISSNGGEVDAGVTFYNFLKALPVEIVMHNVGTIDSIANVIFVAGGKRYASPHSTFLFHGVKMNFGANAQLSLPQLNEIRTRIQKNHNTIAGIVCGNTKMTEDKIKRLFNEGGNL